MSHTGDNAGNAIKRGFTSIHGLGEAIRGNINQFADSAGNAVKGSKATEENKNRNIAERGVDEMQTGHYHGTGAGVTPVDTPAEKVNRAQQGEGSHFANAKHGETSHHV